MKVRCLCRGYGQDPILKSKVQGFWLDGVVFSFVLVFLLSGRSTPELDFQQKRERSTRKNNFETKWEDLPARSFEQTCEDTTHESSIFGKHARTLHARA